MYAIIAKKTMATTTLFNMENRSMQLLGYPLPSSYQVGDLIQFNATPGHIEILKHLSRKK